jgi:tetratricopeptide (TPR) repeat protein
MDKFTDAERDYSRAIEHEPGNAVAYAMRGRLRLYHLKGVAWDDILSDLRSAVRLNNDDHASHFALGYVYSSCQDKKIRDGERAVRHAQKACELTRFSNSEYLGILAAAYAQAGKFEDAVARLEQAIELAKPAEKKALEPLLKHYRDRQPPP